MRDKLTGITNHTKYLFSIKNENQTLAKALGLNPKKILELKRFLTKSTSSESDNLDIKEIIQKRKEPKEYIDDIMAEEIFHHYQNGNLPLDSSMLTDISKFSEKVGAAEDQFFHIIKKILKEIKEANTFDAMDFPDKNIDIKYIKSFIDQQVNECEKKDLAELNNTQLRSLQGYAFIYLLYRYPDKSILQQENYIHFMGRWMALQNARQDLHHFLTSPPVRKAFLGNKLGGRLQVVEFSNFHKAVSNVLLDPTDTSEIIYKHPAKGWCLYNRVMPDDPHVLEEIFPSVYTQTQVKKVLKESRDSIIPQIKNKNNSLIKIEETKSLMEIKKTPLELEALQYSSPKMTLLSGKNSEGKTTALASLMDVAAIQNLEILVIWQHINTTKIQPIHYFNPDSSSSEEILKTKHLLAVSPYEKIILQTGEPALDENEKKSNDKILEIYQSGNKDLTQIIIKDGNKATYVKGSSCQALLTNLKEIQLTFPTQKDSKIVIRDLLQVQQITMLCGLTTFHSLKVVSREPYYQSRFDKKPLPLGLEDCDLLLMSIDQDKKIDVNFFQTFSKPILIKQNQKFSLYGRNEQGNRQITANLNAEAFKDLSFPELESKTVHSSEYDFHVVIIKDEQPMDMSKIRKHIIKNTSDSLPFIIHRGDEFFIYGQVKNGKWQLSKKLDSQFHLKLDVSEEEKDSPLTLLTQRDFLMFPMKTGAGGDCALHAILGGWDPDSKQIYCKEVAKRREELKEFLLTQRNSPAVQKLIADGIIALIMAGSNAGQHTQSLQREYQLICLTHDEKHRDNWQKFHHNIKQYPLILEYIQKNHKLQNSDSFLHQFHSALNTEGNTLSARMLSLPDLWAAFQQYNQLQEFDWVNRISEDMRKEYADFVCQPRTWLLPCELAIIAKAFHIGALYYPCAGAKPEILNEDEKITVAVQFDGQNHYERLDVKRYYRLLPKNQAPDELYKEIASKKMHRFFNASQTATVLSEKIPAIVYKEIAAKKAHFPKFPTILHHVNHNMKQKKREQWAEQYFYLTVDAILRATDQKEYFPWVKTLLGPPLQKYANGGAWINPSSDIAVIRRYEGQILQALIECIANLETEDNKRVMQYAKTKWQKTLQETQSELKKERSDSESSTEDEKDFSENDFRTKIHIQNLRRTEGIIEGLLEEKCINPLLPKDSEESKDYIQKRLLNAKAEWLRSGAKERAEVFFSLKEQMRNHLFEKIKTDYSKQIKKALEKNADMQFSTYFEHFFLDKENNFIHSHHEKRINLLLRFTHQFLNSSVLDNFYQDWNWKKLISHIKQEINIGFRHHHPEDSFNGMLARKSALDNFKQDGYLKKMFHHIEHQVNINFGHRYSEESFDDMLTRKEIKKIHNPPQPALPKPAALCDAYQHDSTTWLREHLPKNDSLSGWLRFSEGSLTTRLMKSLLSTEIDLASLRHIREPSTGNTLLHLALLRYRQSYIQEDTESLKHLLLIIKELFMREACFTALNHQKVTPWHFAQLTGFLGSQQQNERLNADYELLLEGFQNLPIETEVSYIVIDGLVNFLQASTQQIQSSIKFAAIKKGKVHRIKIVKNILDEYLKKAHHQNDQVLRAEICKIISKKTFPSGFFSLREGGDSMLLKIAKQMHKLMKQIAPEGEPIHLIAICRETHIIELENNTIQPQEGVIYLIPNADNFTVDAQWINNKTWYHAKFRTKEYDLCLTPTKDEKIEFGKLYLKEINGKIAYTVMVSIDETVTNIPTKIKAPAPFNLNNLAPLKEAILKVTSEAGHTSRKKILSSIISPWFLARYDIQKMPKTSDPILKPVVLKPGVLYVEKRDLNNLAYKTLDAEGKTVGGVIAKTRINNTHDILEPFDINRLNFFLPQILEITYKNDHTPPALMTFNNSKDPDIVKQVASLCNCRVTPYYISSPVISFNEDLPASIEPETPGYFPISLALTYTSTLVKKVDDKDIQIQKLEKRLEEKDKELQELKQLNSSLKKLIKDHEEKWQIRDEKYEKEKKEAEDLRKKEKADADERDRKLQQQIQRLMQIVLSLPRSTIPPSIPSAGPEAPLPSDRTTALESPDVRFFTSLTPGPASASSQTPSPDPGSSSSSSSSMYSSTTSPSSDSTTGTASSNSSISKT